MACEVAKDGFEANGTKNRLFHEFEYAARSWRRTQRVIARIEHGPKGRNPRFIVTNLPGEANELYERVYCQRGDMENRIKDQQLALFAWASARPDLEHEVVDQPVPGAAGRAGLHPARDDAPHRAAGDALGPGAMPNASASAAQDRHRGDRGDPKYPHRGGATVQRLPRPGRVPALGAPADRRIASRSPRPRPRATTSNPVPERRVALRTTVAVRLSSACPDQAVFRLLVHRLTAG